VVEITGNYYAAYSAEKMSPEQRAKETFDKIVLPILRLEVPRFQSNSNVQGYAFEISHHIVGKVMNVPVEHAENLAVVLPQDAAIRLVATKDESIRQAALLKGEVYLNPQPVTIWLKVEGPQLAAQNPPEEQDQPKTGSLGTVLCFVRDRQVIRLHASRRTGNHGKLRADVYWRLRKLQPCTPQLCATGARHFQHDTPCIGTSTA